MKNANIYGVKNAPEGFIAWAKQHGAVQNQSDSPRSPRGWVGTGILSLNGTVARILPSNMGKAVYEISTAIAVFRDVLYRTVGCQRRLARSRFPDQARNRQRQCLRCFVCLRGPGVFLLLDAETATDAYLAQIPADATARSNANFEGVTG